MERYGFRLRLRNQAVIGEYERMHAEVGEEILEAHRRAGFRNYAIFRSGLDLFGVFESEDASESLVRILRDPVMESWFKRAEPFLEYNEQGKPKFETLREVFYLP